jgi:GNAT superfamily N-acetyltransferase
VPSWQKARAERLWDSPTPSLGGSRETMPTPDGASSQSLLSNAGSRGIVLAIDRARPFGPEVVGFSHFNGNRFGPIGVAKAARHRGVGQVLAWDTLMAQRSAGFASAYFLWSDDETARRLYDGLGFVVARRFTVLRKTL